MCGVMGYHTCEKYSSAAEGEIKYTASDDLFVDILNFVHFKCNTNMLVDVRIG